MPGHSPSKTGVTALMAGHVSLWCNKDVDGRVKPDHDEAKVAASARLRPATPPD
jgi:hypothetical protein